MIKFSLNGWQRLWVLVGVIYACAMAVFYILNFPNDLTIGEYLGNPNIELGNHVPTEPVCYVLIKKRWVKVDHTARNKENDECIYLRDNEWSEPISCEDFRRVDLPREFNEVDKRKLKLKQAKFTGKYLILWIIPLIMIYLFGHGVAWASAV